MRTRKTFSVGLAFLAVALGLCPVLSAQTSTTGAIEGRITDPQGGAVTFAEVVATNLGTNERHTVQSAEFGNYVAPLLPVGQYQLEIRATGFAVSTISPIIVRVTERVTCNVTLKVDTVKDTVNVSSSVTALNTTSSALGGVVNGQTADELPLATRNYTQLMVLSPGVLVSVPDASAMGLNGVELSAEGSRLADNSVQLNGVNATNYFTNTLGSYVGGQGVAVPAPDSLDEFKVQTGLYDASTGRGAGANIAVVTKSGTNTFHGTAYEFLRNDAFNANGFFFNEAHQPKPVLKQNQFGFTFGGPIQKNETFFFVSYQGTHQINGAAPGTQSTLFLPPLTDDRSAAVLGATFGGQKAFQAFAPGGLGVAIASDGSNINPVALALLNYKLPNGQFLIPNPQTSNGLSVFSVPGTFNDDQFNVNLDQELGRWGRLSGKYFYATQHTELPFYSATVPGFPASAPGGNQNLSVADTKAFSPTWANVLRLGYTRSLGKVITSNPVSTSEIGMNTDVTELPLLSVLGEFSLGVGIPGDIGIISNDISVADTLTYQRGRHLFQFGAEVDVLRSSFTWEEGVNGFAYLLDFPSFLLGQAAGTNGFVYSDIALNASSSGSHDRDYQGTNYAAFFQDDFRVNPRLTLNLGLRYDLFGGVRDAQGRDALFDYGIATKDVPASGSYSGYVVGPGFPGSVPDGVTVASDDTLRINRNRRDFEPRVGFAYAATKALVVRGGYGIYFSPRPWIDIWENASGYPFNTFVFNQLVPGSTATLQNPLPAIPPPSAFPLFVPRTPTSTQQFSTWNPRMHDPYTQERSLGIQYEFAPTFLLEIAYVGSKGTHLTGESETNEPILASPSSPVHGITTNTVANAPLRVPYQGIAPTSTGFYDSIFDANYNSLQISVTKQVSRGLQFTSAYTFGKSLDDLTQVDNAGGAATTGIWLYRAGASGDSHNISQGKGPSDFDRKHRFVFSYVWEPPRVRSGTAVLRGIVNGWQTSGLLTLQSGLPFSVVDTTAASIYGQTNSRAQFAPGFTGLNAGFSGPVTSRLNEYFNINAFTTAPVIGDGTGFGNSGRNILWGPDQRNFDLAVTRNFVIHEKANLQFRAEAFNLTNTPSFGNPGSDRGTPATFGRISTTTVNPRILQLALRLAF